MTRMTTLIQLSEQRLSALAKLARRRKLPLRCILERAVDEFIERAEDEDLLDRSARVARQTGLREADAVEIVRSWRRSHT